MDIHRYNKFVRNRYYKSNAYNNPIKWRKKIVSCFIFVLHTKVPFLNCEIEIIYRYIDYSQSNSENNAYKFNTLYD